MHRLSRQAKEQASKGEVLEETNAHVFEMREMSALQVASNFIFWLTMLSFVFSTVYCKDRLSSQAKGMEACREARRHLSSDAHHAASRVRAICGCRQWKA